MRTDDVNSSYTTEYDGYDDYADTDDHNVCFSELLEVKDTETIQNYLQAKERLCVTIRRGE